MVEAPASAELVRLIRRIEFATLPPEIVHLAEQCLLDWLGVTLAGMREPLVLIVLRQLAAAEGAGESTLLRIGKTSLLTAALVHGTAAHALDYDDTNWILQGHPTAPVASGLVSLAERENASGRQLLAALVAGIELECRLGRWLNPSHYERGFHATATLGCFGATAAACHLLRAPESVWLHALGLASSQATGLKSAFGSMTKPLQVGRAAQTGLMCALLAADGFTSNPAGLEGEQGFARTHADPSVDLAQLTAEPERYYIGETLFKYYAACHLTHASIEALRQLQRQHAGLAERVRAVELYVDPVCFGVCNVERPSSALEAKFSLRAVAAMVLLGDDLSDPNAFVDSQVARPELAGWLERIDVRAESQPATSSRVVLVLADGSKLTAASDVGIPNRDLEDQGRRLARKFERLVGPRAGELRAAVEGIAGGGSVRELLTLAAST